VRWNRPVGEDEVAYNPANRSPSERLQDKVRFDSEQSHYPTVSSRAAAAPPHILTDPLLAQSTPHGPRVPLLNFRKIPLYGKTKKSTHDHTNHLPFRTTFGSRA
jgi:hypothetical protein